MSCHTCTISHFKLKSGQVANAREAGFFTFFIIQILVENFRKNHF